MITEVCKDIKYVGCDDAELRLFEGQYVTPDGMCYNSYVILDDQVAIMDTCDARCADDWADKVARALDGRQPDYLVAHHMEPDHAGSIARLLAAYPQVKVVCSAMAAKMLGQFNEDLNLEGRMLTVKEGDTLPLGHHTLQFVAAPSVHWPEVMMSYAVEDQVLFSADGFGKFGVYDADADDWACEARRYYFNICGKYGVQVAKVLAKAQALPGIQAICPLHGPVLTGTKMQEALRLYNIWAHYEVETPGVFIAYASAHGGTAAAAEQMRQLLLQRGCPKVAIADLCRSDMAENIEDAFRYGTLLCCAASYDAGVFPAMHTFLHKLSTKGYQKRRIALLENGSWAPCAARAMKAVIEKMKDITLVEPTVTIMSRMHRSDLPHMEKLADNIMETFKA